MPIKIFRTEKSIYVQKDTVENFLWRNSFLYTTMNPNNEYDDHSALDAPDLTQRIENHLSINIISITS